MLVCHSTPLEYDARPSKLDSDVHFLNRNSLASQTKQVQIESIECTHAEYEFCESYNGKYVVFRAYILVRLFEVDFGYTIWKYYPPDLERFESGNGITPVFSVE